MGIEIRFELTAATAVFVGWMVFYSMVIGLMWFGITAHSESSRCVATYEKYIEEANWACGVEMGGGQKVYLNFTNPTAPSPAATLPPV